MSTKIEWAEETWNPIVGCSKVSPGCNNCYAERMAGRLAGMGLKPYLEVVEWDDHPEDPKPMQQWNGKTTLVRSTLDKPMKRKKPTVYFVCSMGDLFHEKNDELWIGMVFSVMMASPQHTFLVLTKRPERMAEFYKSASMFPMDSMLPNVWLGVTAENQEQADKRIPILLDIPAAKRFVSVEPMLGPIFFPQSWVDEARYFELGVLHWVICGSESGPGRRPMDLNWTRNLKEQCIAADVPFLFKQKHDKGKKITLPELDGKVWNQKPE